MIGIYRIRNLVNQKIYIGQSIDIARRFTEHLRAGQPEKYAHKNNRDINLPLHRAIQKYGINNFKLEILQECEKEELDQLEKYYIKKYDSTNREKGYNISEGGQDKVGTKGELHSQAKLTQKEVDNIYLLLQQNMPLIEINKIYPQISKSTLSMINHGKVWKKENYTYPLSQQKNNRQGSNNKNALVNEAEVMQIRQYYVNHTFKEVIEQFKNLNISQGTIRSIVYGDSWKHLPIYKKKTKTWIKPCIDYSQSLK